jgi:hypothetical protein
MTAETAVTVVVGSEVSAQVLPTASNTVQHIATSTDLTLVQTFIQWLTSWI